MQISVQSTGPLERTLQIEVPEETIANEVENRLKSLSRTTKIQGFRPGKVPFKLIQQRFGSRVRQEVIGDVVQSSFYEAVTQENLRPAGTPQIDPLQSKLGEGLSYTAKFEVFPEIQLKPVEELEIEQPRCEITSEDIDKMLEVLRKQRRTPEIVEREAREGDVVNIDFIGTIDGTPFEGGEAQGFELELGTKRFIEGFEEGLIGKKAGDALTLDLHFPETYPKAELAGKPVSFQTTVNRISELVLPALDDDFFAGFGVKEGGLDALKANIREHMERESEQAVKNRLRDSVLSALYAANELELPISLVLKEKKHMAHHFEENLKGQGIEIDDARRAENDTLFEQRARKRVALQLIVTDIVRQNGLEPDPAQVRAYIEKNAESYQDPSAIINWYYSDKERLAEIEALVLEDAVVDWVSCRARKTEVNLTFDECMNNGQTEAP